MVRSYVHTIQVYLNGLDFKLQNEIKALAVSRSTLDSALEIVAELLRTLDERSQHDFKPRDTENIRRKPVTRSKPTTKTDR